MRAEALEPHRPVLTQGWGRIGCFQPPWDIHPLPPCAARGPPHFHQPHGVPISLLETSPWCSCSHSSSQHVSWGSTCSHQAQIQFPATVETPAGPGAPLGYRTGVSHHLQIGTWVFTTVPVPRWQPCWGRQAASPRRADFPPAPRLCFSFLSQRFLHRKAFLGTKRQPGREANEGCWMRCLINHFSGPALGSPQGPWPGVGKKICSGPQPVPAYTGVMEKSNVEGLPPPLWVRFIDKARAWQLPGV